MANLDHLVVGLDGSAGSKRAREGGATPTPQRLTLVHGYSPGLELLASAFQVDLDPVRAGHQELLETEWSAPARASGAEIETVLVDDYAAHALTRSATTRHADAIVIGHQGHTRWSKNHVGEIAGRLLHHSDVPVILTNETTEPAPLSSTIVVGLGRPADDKSPELIWSLEVGHREQVPIHLVTVLEPIAYVNASYPSDMDAIYMEIREQMDALVLTLRQQHPSVDISSELREGPAVARLAGVANGLGASLVVVGSHHPGRVAGYLAGSASHLLPPMLRCPMAAVPAR